MLIYFWAFRGCHFVCNCPSVSEDILRHRVAVSGCLAAPFHPGCLIRTWRKSVAGDGVRRQDGTVRQLDADSIRGDTHNKSPNSYKNWGEKRQKRVSFFSSIARWLKSKRIVLNVRRWRRRLRRSRMCVTCFRCCRDSLAGTWTHRLACCYLLICRCLFLGWRSTNRFEEESSVSCHAMLLKSAHPWEPVRGHLQPARAWKDKF